MKKFTSSIDIFYTTILMWWITLSKLAVILSQALVQPSSPGRTPCISPRTALCFLVDMPGFTSRIVTPPVDQRPEFHENRPVVNAPAIGPPLFQGRRTVPGILRMVLPLFPHFRLLLMIIDRVGFFRRIDLVDHPVFRGMGYDIGRNILDHAFPLYGCISACRIPIIPHWKHAFMQI